MKMTIKALDEKARKLEQELAKIARCKETLIELFETPQGQPKQVTIAGPVKPEPAKPAKKRGGKPNPNRASVKLLLPIVKQNPGITLQELYEKAVPRKGNKQQYAKNTFRSYVYYLRGEGLIEHRDGKIYATAKKGRG